MAVSSSLESMPSVRYLLKWAKDKFTWTTPGQVNLKVYPALYKKQCKIYFSGDFTNHSFVYTTSC